MTYYELINNHLIFSIESFIDRETFGVSKSQAIVSQLQASNGHDTDAAFSV